MNTKIEIVEFSKFLKSISIFFFVETMISSYIKDMFESFTLSKEKRS